MADKQIKIKLGFNAEVEQAMQKIQKLSNTLNSIANTNVSISGGNLEAATKAAKILNQEILKATNAETGKLDFSKLQSSLKSSGQDLNQLTNQILAMGPKGQQAFNQVASAIATAELRTKKMNSTLAKFGTTLMNTIRWQASTAMINAFTGTVQSAIRYVEDLDKSLNNIRIVTGKNTLEMASFAKQANEAAKVLKTTTVEYSNASLIYFQQGLPIKEVQERTEATVKMAQVTGNAVEEVSNQLTAIWNNFDNGTKSLEYYADVITALGAATASSTEEIATGLEKFAAIAETVGLSYEYATAALATVTAETRQSAEVVGTAFKTLFARIQDLELGKTLDDGTTLGQYSEALAKVGINIKDSNGNLKDMNDILDDMGAKWDTLTKDSQVALAQNVAGVRQYTQLMALMENYDVMKENLETAKNATGELDKQHKIYQSSLEALDDELKATSEGLYNDLLNPEMLAEFKKALIDIVKMFDRVAEAAGGLKGMLQFGGLLLIQKLLPYLGSFMVNTKNHLADMIGLTQRKQVTTIKNMADQQRAMSNSGVSIQSSDSQGSIKQVDNNINLGIMDGKDIEQESARLSADILDHKAKLIKMQDTLTEKQRKQYQAYIEELEAKKEALRLAREEQLSKEEQLKTSKLLAANAVGRNKTERQYVFDENKKQELIKEREIQKQNNIISLTNEQVKKKEEIQTKYNQDKEIAIGNREQIKNTMDQVDLDIEQLKNKIKNEQQALEILQTRKDNGEILSGSDEETFGATKRNLEQNQQLLANKRIEKENLNIELEGIDSVLSENIDKVIQEKLKSMNLSDQDIQKRASEGLMTDEQINELSKREASNLEYEVDSSNLKESVEYAKQDNKIAQNMLKDLGMVGENEEFSGGSSVKNLEALNKKRAELETDSSVVNDLSGELNFLATKISEINDNSIEDTESQLDEETEQNTQRIAEAAETLVKQQTSDGDIGQPNTNQTNLAEIDTNDLSDISDEDLFAYDDKEEEKELKNNKKSSKQNETKKDDKTQKQVTLELEKQEKIQKKVNEYTTKYNENWKQALARSGATKDQITKLSDTTKKLDLGKLNKQELELMSKAMRKLQGDINSAGDAANHLSEAMISDLSRETDTDGEVFVDVADNAKEAENAVHEVSEAFEDYNNQQNEGPDIESRWETTKNVVNQATNALTNGIMGVQTATMGLNMAFSEEATLTERLSGGMMALQGIMSLLNAAKTVGTIVMTIATAASKREEKQSKKTAKQNTAETLTWVQKAASILFAAEATKGVAGAMLAAAAVAVVVGTVLGASVIMSQKLAKAKEEEAEQTANAAEKSKEQAKAAEEEYNELKKLSKEYKDILKIYEETGKQKDDLITKAQEVADAADVEGARLLILTENYAELNRQIEKNLKLKAQESVKQQQVNVTQAAIALSAKTKAEKGGMWINTETQKLGIQYTDKNGKDQGKDKFIKKFLDDEEGKKYRDIGWRFGDNHLYAKYSTNEEAAYIASTLELLLNDATAWAYKNGFDETNITNSEIIKRYQNMKATGEQEQLTSFIESGKSSVKSQIENFGIQTKIEDTSDWISWSKYYTNFEQNLKNAGINIENEYYKDMVDEYLKAQGETVQDFVNFRKSIKDTNNTALENFSVSKEFIDWIQSNNFSFEEGVKLLVELKPDEKASNEAILNSLKEQQGLLEGKSLEIKMDYNTQALSELKENMSPQDWLDFQSKYSELFNEKNHEKYLGLSFEDFVSMGYDTQRVLLNFSTEDRIEAIKKQIQGQKKAVENAENDLNRIKNTVNIEAISNEEQQKLEEKKSELEKKQAYYNNTFVDAEELANMKDEIENEGTSKQKPVYASTKRDVRVQGLGFKNYEAYLEEKRQVETAINNLQEEINDSELYGNGEIEEVIKANSKLESERTKLDNLNRTKFLLENQLKQDNIETVFKDDYTTDSKKWADKKNNLEEEIESYYTLNKLLEKEEHELNLIDKEFNKAYGNDKLKLLNQKIKSQEKTLQLDKQILEVMKSNAEAAKSELASIGGQFDENGILTNYEELITTWTNEYNNQITALEKEAQIIEDMKYSLEKDKQSGLSEQAIAERERAIEKREKALEENEEKNQEKYDERIKLVEKYGKAWDDVNKKTEKTQDDINKIAEDKLAKIQLEVELKLTITEASKKTLDYYLSKTEDDFYSLAEGITLLQKKAGLEIQDLSTYETEMNKIVKNTQLSPQQKVDELEKLQDNFINTMQAISEIDKQVMEYYTSALSKSKEEMEKYTSQLDSATSKLEHFTNLAGIIGKSYDYKYMGEIFKAQYDVAQKNVEASKGYMDQLKQQKAGIEEQMKTATEGEKELLEKQLEAITTSLNEAEEEWLSGLKAMAEVAKSILENSLAKSRKALEEGLYGGSLQDYIDGLDRLSAEQEGYLTKTNKLYEINKLIRQAQMDMDKTSNTRAKQQYNDYVKYIEQMQKSGQLSEYELSIAQAKYDVLQAQIALEEAKDAKDQVRLTRDSEGNFGYVYTANANKIADAQQKLEDANNKLYNIGLDGYKEFTLKQAQLQQEALNAIEEILNDETLTREKKEKKILEIQDHYNTLMKNNEEQYNLAIGIIRETSHNQQLDYNTEAIVSAETFKKKTDGYLKEVRDAYDEYDTKVSDVKEAVGGDLDALKTKTDEVKTATDLLKSAIDNLNKNIGSELKHIQDRTTEWGKYRDTMLESIKATEKLMKISEKMITAYSGGKIELGQLPESDDHSRDIIEMGQAGEPWTEVVGHVVARSDKILNDKKLNDQYTRGEILTTEEVLRKAGYNDEEIKQIKRAAIKHTQLGTVFDTGGYTGSWGPEGKWAMLHEKEIVLNKQDTSNLLQAITMLREISNMIDRQAMYQSLSLLDSRMFDVFAEKDNKLQQEVTIHAEFPNVNDHNEIEIALNDLVTRASQYANRF